MTPASWGLPDTDHSKALVMPPSDKMSKLCNFYAADSLFGISNTSHPPFTAYANETTWQPTFLCYSLYPEFSLRSSQVSSTAADVRSTRFRRALRKCPCYCSSSQFCGCNGRNGSYLVFRAKSTTRDDIRDVRKGRNTNNHDNNLL